MRRYQQTARFSYNRLLESNMHLFSRDIKEYVKERLKQGGILPMPDNFSMEEHRRPILDRKILRFCREFILTQNRYGRREAFQYYDVFTMLRGRK